MTIQPQEPADPERAAELREREARAKAPTGVTERLDENAERRARDMASLQGREPVLPFKARVNSIARAFHETYEAMAPDHGYETRKESAVGWADVPQPNKDLMCAVVEHLLREGVIR